jgi:hypothetical protein
MAAAPSVDRISNAIHDAFFWTVTVGLHLKLTIFWCDPCDWTKPGKDERESWFFDLLF